MIQDESHRVDPCAKLREQVDMQERWLNRFLEASKAMLAGDSSQLQHFVNIMEFAEALVYRNSGAEDGQERVDQAIRKFGENDE